MLEFSEQELTVRNCSKIGGADPRLISQSHHLDTISLRGKLKIELNFDGINTFAISKDHPFQVWTLEG